jgi:hypothetical protein
VRGQRPHDRDRYHDLQVLFLLVLNWRNI